MTDPTRTEDVEERTVEERVAVVLGAIADAYSVQATKAQNKGDRVNADDFRQKCDAAGWAADRLRDLRELLEETQADLHHTKRKMVDPEEMHRARRRADRLEEALRDISRLSDYADDGHRRPVAEAKGIARHALYGGER